MKRLQTLLSLFCALVGLHTFAQSAPSNSLTMYVGTYTEGGNSKGIYTYSFDQQQGTSVLLGSTAAANPSFIALAPNGKHLYAVSEYNDGRQRVYSFEIGQDKLPSQPVFQPTQTGADPCHIIADSKYAITANYTGGDISIFLLNAAGKLQAEIQYIAFEGRTPERVAHIHCMIPTPDGKYVLATDLGNDCIYRFRYNQEAPQGAEVFTDQQIAYLVSDGQGPRHLTFSKDGRFAYLINELGGECVVLSYHKGKIKEVQRLMADEGQGGGSADIHISPDGRFLYTSHRLKKDGISIFAIDPKRGTLKKVGYQLTGIHPRNFAITPNGKYLLVACRDDNKIQVFQRNATTGTLTDTSQHISVDKPTCIIFTEIINN